MLNSLSSNYLDGTLMILRVDNHRPSRMGEKGRSETDTCLLYAKQLVEAGNMAGSAVQIQILIIFSVNSTSSRATSDESGIAHRSIIYHVYSSESIQRQLSLHS